MTISMIRGYAPPPAEGGAAYQGFSQYGYTHITQEGTGWSEPHAESFDPLEHLDAYGEHPYVSPRRHGFSVPGPLGGCACVGGGCGCGPTRGLSGFGEMGTGAKLALGLAALFVGRAVLKGARRRRRSRR